VTAGRQRPTIVRSASAADAAALGALRLRWFSEAGRPGELGDDAFTGAFTSWTDAHRSTHLPFLAETDDDVVGMAWLMVAERVPTPDRLHRRFGDVQSVYVAPEHRHHGVGTALMRTVLAQALALDLEHVTVHSSDRALALYRAAGFVQDEHWLRWSPPRG
jgi:ribosomal protein S18 acetylase RimI-like enzyme